MRLKILSLIFFIPALVVALFVAARVVNAETPRQPSDYFLSGTSFESSSNNDAYVYDSGDQKLKSQSRASAILGLVWTKTGNIVNALNNQLSNPLAQTSGTSTVYLLSAGFVGTSPIAKILGPGHTIFSAMGHPFIFLMTLSFGTILLSLWFLRLSTGVSPPSPAEALREGGLNLFRF